MKRKTKKKKNEIVKIKRKMSKIQIKQKMWKNSGGKRKKQVSKKDKQAKNVKI